MEIILIVVLVVGALVLSGVRIARLRARHKSEQAEAERDGTAADSAPTNESTPAHTNAKTFADFLNADCAPAMTKAAFDEWRCDFVLARKYARAPQPLSGAYVAKNSTPPAQSPCAPLDESWRQKYDAFYKA